MNIYIVCRASFAENYNTVAFYRKLPMNFPQISRNIENGEIAYCG